MDVFFLKIKTYLDQEVHNSRQGPSFNLIQQQRQMVPHPPLAASKQVFEYIGMSINNSLRNGCLFSCECPSCKAASLDNNFWQISPHFGAKTFGKCRREIFYLKEKIFFCFLQKGKGSRQRIESIRRSQKFTNASLSDCPANS